jgi:hypothetical protein
MGIWDRDYMHERWKRQLLREPATSTRRPSSGPPDLLPLLRRWLPALLVCFALGVVAKLGVIAITWAIRS